MYTHGVDLVSGGTLDSLSGMVNGNADLTAGTLTHSGTAQTDISDTLTVSGGATLDIQGDTLSAGITNPFSSNGTRVAHFKQSGGTFYAGAMELDGSSTYELSGG